MNNNYYGDYEPSLISHNVKRLRAKRGMTQQKLAIEAGLSIQTVRKYEQELIKRGTFSVLVALANALLVPWSDLLLQKEE